MTGSEEGCHSFTLHLRKSMRAKTLMMTMRNTRVRMRSDLIIKIFIPTSQICLFHTLVLLFLLLNWFQRRKRRLSPPLLVRAYALQHLLLHELYADDEGEHENGEEHDGLGQVHERRLRDPLHKNDQLQPVIVRVSYD